MGSGISYNMGSRGHKCLKGNTCMSVCAKGNTGMSALGNTGMSALRKYRVHIVWIVQLMSNRKVFRSCFSWRGVSE